MSALSHLLWWRRPSPVAEPRPILTSEKDRATREHDAEQLRKLMELLDAELDALRTGGRDD